jgi:hypothetical protein
LSCWVQHNWYCELEQEERSHIKKKCAVIKPASLRDMLIYSKHS